MSGCQSKYKCPLRDMARKVRVSKACGMKNSSFFHSPTNIIYMLLALWSVGFKQKLAILAKTKQGLVSLEKKGLKVKF